jgi:hypothetical protein
VLQKYAAEIYAIDAHAVCPHDPREARVLLDKLQKERGAPRESGQDRRLAQLHECYNAMLPVLAKAKRVGVRPADAKPPAFRQGCEVSPDALKEMQEFSQQLDIDIAEWEAHTPDQRRIARLEARLAMMVVHSNGLVDACKDYEQRIARLEAVIVGPRAA